MADNLNILDQSSAGVTDHGQLDGLGDDDHAIYPLRSAVDAVPLLTDNSGGATPDGTVENLSNVGAALTDEAAQRAAVNVRLGIINDNFADVVARINELRNAIDT